LRLSKNNGGLLISCYVSKKSVGFVSKGMKTLYYVGGNNEKFLELAYKKSIYLLYIATQ